MGTERIDRDKLRGWVWQSRSGSASWPWPGCAIAIDRRADPSPQAKTELDGINRELKRLKMQAAVLEERKAKLMADLGK